MSDRRDLSISEESGKAEAFDSGNGPALPVIGTWYWVLSDNNYYKDDDDIDLGDRYEWLGCVMAVGSNYVKMEGPTFGGGSMTSRVHFDNIDNTLRFEPNAEAIIESRRRMYQDMVQSLLGEVQEVTRRLGVAPATQIADKSSEGTNALVALSSQVDTSAYKNALIEAKEKTLPDLFKEIERANKKLAGWMTAPTLPTLATIGPMKKNIGAIEDRIYTIELYAGLTEDAVQCCEGEPAAMDEKLHVMQRRLYMDEECLLNYVGGGIEIRDVRQFDKWISTPENRDRILPFPRCLVAFRVRREEKEREDDGSIWRMFVNAQIAQADKRTFLYVRNGEQVWRIDCDFVFDELIFPNQSAFDPAKPMMAKMFAGRVDKIITRDEWEARWAEEQEQKRLHQEWKAAHPGENAWNSPHRFYGESMKDYKPFDSSNVYYDEVASEFSDMMKRYNRVAVIIQGLFDRSLVLHPHPPVKVWDPVSFSSAIELIYDANTLVSGEKPDFEAYRAKLNASIGIDSIVTGQEDYWLRREAARENKRQANDWRNRNPSNYTRYRPYSDPGPGLVSRMVEWKSRARKAVFRWVVETQDWNANSPTKPKMVEVPADALFNVSAYQPGDYKMFLSDHRTRAEYLKWAPLMLAAEDYHAGKLELEKSSGVETWSRF